MAAAVPELARVRVGVAGLRVDPAGRSGTPGWFLVKTFAFLFVYIWFRGTFPRYRFDQLMALGWKVFLPVSLVNLMVVALGVLLLGGPR